MIEKSVNNLIDIITKRDEEILRLKGMLEHLKKMKLTCSS